MQWKTLTAAAALAAASVAAPAYAGTSFFVQVAPSVPGYVVAQPGVVAYGSNYDANYGGYYAQPQVVYGAGYYPQPRVVVSNGVVGGPRAGWRGRDRDHDGVANRYDRDRDGDGVPNWRDRRPNNPYRR